MRRSLGGAQVSADVGKDVKPISDLTEDSCRSRSSSSTSPCVQTLTALSSPEIQDEPLLNKFRAQTGFSLFEHAARPQGDTHTSLQSVCVCFHVKSCEQLQLLFCVTNRTDESIELKVFTIKPVDR